MDTSLIDAAVSKAISGCKQSLEMLEQKLDAKLDKSRFDPEWDRMWDKKLKYAIYAVIGAAATSGGGAVVVMAWMWTRSHLDNQIKEAISRQLDEERQSLITVTKAAKEQMVKIDDLMYKSHLVLQELPLGTILPIACPPDTGSVEYFEGIIPRNWAICDGSEINGRHRRKYKVEEVSALFWNKNVPDLVDRFPRGVEPGAEVSKMGGSWKIPEHKHGLPAQTGSVSVAEARLSSGSYTVRDNDGTDANHIVVHDGSSGEGHHAHDLGGTTTDLRHNVDSHPFMPKYTNVVYLIRIK